MSRETDGSKRYGRIDIATCSTAMVMMFELVWQNLEMEGACDTFGGAESERVFQEWSDQMLPSIEAFIRKRANHL